MVAPALSTENLAKMPMRDGWPHEPVRLARQSFLAVSGAVDRASLPQRKQRNVR